MTYNYAHAIRMAHRQIAKYGGGANNARLLRDGVQRPCTCCLVQFTNSERIGSLIQFGDRKALISNFNVTVPPSFEEQDVLIFGMFVKGKWQERERLRIVQPVTELAPAGVVVYWQMQVRR